MTSTIIGTAGAASHEFDAAFARNSAGLPVAFLRALGKRESNLNPNETKGTHWGILQVGWKGKNSPLAGYNLKNGTTLTKQDLLNVDTNIRLATGTLARIVLMYRAAYLRNPQLLVNLRPDMNNPEFVKLLLAGWNSGYSKKAGVLKVAAYMVKHHIFITHDGVFANAAKAGATKYLRASVPGEAGAHARKKQRWQRGVAAFYRRQPDFAGPKNISRNAPPGGPAVSFKKASIPLAIAFGALTLWGLFA